MATPTRFASLLLFAALLSSCAAEVGNGLVATEDRPIGRFGRLSVQSGIRAEVVRGASALRLRTDANLLRLVEAWVADDTLFIRLQPDVVVRSTGGIRADIATEVLVGVAASGGSTVTAAGTYAESWPLTSSGGSQVILSDVSAGELVVDVTGGGGATVRGEAGSLLAVATGGSRLRAEECPVDDADLLGSGGSQLTVRVSRSVRGALSGGSRATVLGWPPVREIETSGGSEVVWGEQ